MEPPPRAHHHARAAPGDRDGDSAAGRRRRHHSRPGCAAADRTRRPVSVRRRPAKVTRAGIALVCTLPFLYPFLYLISTALKTPIGFTVAPDALTGPVTWANFSGAWSQADLGPGIEHSFIAVLVAVLVTVGISAAGGYWFYRHRGRAATTLKVSLIATMAVPPPVYIIPLFLLLNSVHLLNNLYVLGVVYAGWNASFGLYLMSAYLVNGLPSELLDAAAVDGASKLRVFLRIVLPLSRSALATLAVLTFVWSWGDLLISIVLVQAPALRTLMPSAALLAGQFNTDIPVNAAATVIAIVPMLLVFLIGQRFLQRGILAGLGK
jgi:multiple sugar transport system permease protein